jgi:D-sedoheptulose 7-phosphate isomerase
MSSILDELFERYPVLEMCADDIDTAYALLCNCYEEDGTVYVCGNGGSAADSEHIVGELMKSFTIKRKIPDELVAKIGDKTLSDNLEGALPAMSLASQVGLSTAYANDVASEMVFAQQVYGYARPVDVLWALSTSGNSRNVINALKVARAVDCRCLGLTGKDGGAMAALCDVCIRVPETEVYKVQELHLPVYHAICRMLEERFFAGGENPRPTPMA